MGVCRGSAEAGRGHTGLMPPALDPWDRALSGALGKEWPDLHMGVNLFSSRIHVQPYTLHVQS